MATAVLHQPPVTHYNVEVSGDLTALRQAVETAIHDGWQPFGSLVAAPSPDGGPVYAQPMVKYAEWFR